MIKHILLTILLLSANTEVVQAMKMGRFAKSCKSFATLANLAIESGNLKRDVTMYQVDQYHGDHWTDIYWNLCGEITKGPKILVPTHPCRVGFTMVIGFTEETNINSSDGDASEKVDYGRYVFFWDEKFLRATLYKSADFEKLIKEQGINLTETSSFNFPELSKLVSDGLKPNRVIPESAVPDVRSANEIRDANQRKESSYNTQRNSTKISTPGSSSDKWQVRDGNHHHVIFGLFLGSLVLVTITALFFWRREK